MRLIKVSAPSGMASQIAELAFTAGIKSVSIREEHELSAEGKRETKDAIDLSTSTPKGKRFIDNLLNADFYNPQDYSIAVRQPRAIISSENIREITRPLAEPVADIYQELWQFSHITIGFVGRFFIGASFLAYGLIQNQTLMIIAGLLFLPILPTLMGISLSVLTGNLKLAGQGFLAFLATMVILFLSGVAVASFNSPPLKYDEFNPLYVGALISLAVGIAGALANTDDVGRRELIGLAATAQIAIVPVWFGIKTIFGFSADETQSKLLERAAALVLSVAIIVIAALITYFLLGYRKSRVPAQH
ncbi:MAG TPA: hypothetical protein VEQ34_11320 [Pyrinomonadaceae bacterium]|nr:hypothetical protein [Pyrinomonadaceae bacterium]